MYLAYPSKRTPAAIFIPAFCKAQSTLLCGLLRRRRSLVSVKIPGPTISQSRRHGWSLKWKASTEPRQSLKREDIECSSRTRRNHGAKPLAASLLRNTCWWALPSRRRCAKGTSSDVILNFADSSLLSEVGGPLKPGSGLSGNPEKTAVHGVC